MEERKWIAQLDSEFLLAMGINPDEAIRYLESKRAIDMNPIQVTALLIYKQNVVPSS